MTTLNISLTANPESSFFSKEILNLRSTTSTGKIQRVWYTVLSCAYLPIRILKNLQGLIGRMVLRITIAKHSNEADLENIKKDLEITDLWNTLTQFTIKIDESEINAFALTNKKAPDGRWLLVSNGLGGRAINRLQDTTDLATELTSNMLVFDYPGTGDSSGLPCRSTLVKTYHAALNVLQTKFQAKQLVLYGHSFGGGVQAEALRNYTFQKNLSVVAIKSRTFSSMTAATRWIAKHNSAGYLRHSRLHWTADKISSLCGRAAQLFVLLVGWNIKTAEASRNLGIPEIILYSATKKEPSPQKDVPAKQTETYSTQNTPVNDGVIPAEGTLPFGLGKCSKKSKKLFFPVEETHNQDFSKTTLQTLADAVNSLLSNTESSILPLK